MKHCIKCKNPIKETNPNQKWFMMISKKGQKITAFECFHFKCWEQHWKESVKMACEALG